MISVTQVASLALSSVYLSRQRSLKTFQCLNHPGNLVEATSMRPSSGTGLYSSR